MEFWLHWQNDTVAVRLLPSSNFSSSRTRSTSRYWGQKSYRSEEGRNDAPLTKMIVKSTLTWHQVTCKKMANGSCTTRTPRKKGWIYAKLNESPSSMRSKKKKEASWCLLKIIRIGPERTGVMSRFLAFPITWEMFTQVKQDWNEADICLWRMHE